MHGLFCSFFSSLRKHGILKNLRTRKDIVIVRPDKGSGVVILDRGIYDPKNLGIINDTTKFKKLEDNPTLTREGQLQRFLRKIKDKHFFDENRYKKIYPCGSKPATIYVLPKTHKMLFDSDDFLFNQLSLPYALIITILLNFPLNFLIQLYQKSIVVKIRLVFVKKYNR